jgi:colanic acid/amylovoran biosynthesis glycosyltransferase
MHVAYLVSRFPHPSETFIVRELNALEQTGAVEIELASLFPPVDPTVHPAARPWLGRVSRPTAIAAARATLAWLARRPLRSLSTVAVVMREHARNPRVLVRALATLPLGAFHARELRAAGVEHVHAHYATYPALAAWVCSRLTGVPYSFTAHAHDLYVDEGMLARKVADAAFVVTISEFNRRFLAERGADPDRVHVVHCGIDPGAYAFRPRRPPAQGPVRCLCVASLQEYKGHRILLEALAGAESLSRVELDLVGGGPLLAELEARAARLGLSDRVRFHGSAPEERVRELLEGADLFVLPSIVAADGQMEGLPVVLMEALAAGVCPVTTRLSGIPEIVEEGVTGLLAEPGDPRSLRAALERSLDGAVVDPAAGRRLVEAEFDVSRSARRLRALFERATLG